MSTALSTATCSVLTVLGVAALGLTGAAAAHADDAPNAVPDAWDDSYGMMQGSTLTVDAASGILANDTDPDGDLLTVGQAYNYDPAELTVNNDGSFSFTPAAGFVGVATFNYTAADGHQHWSYSRTVSITVEAAPVLPAVPAGSADFYSTPQDTVLTVPASGLLANDTGAVAVVDLKDQPVGLAANFDGSFSYSPPAGFTGDVSFSYRMSNGSDTLSEWIPVTITVTPPQPAEVANESGLDTLAYTGDVSGWLAAPALALLSLGGFALWISRRRAQVS